MHGWNYARNPPAFPNFQPAKIMSYDEDWPDNTMENRIAEVRRTIHPVSLDDLKRMGDRLFPIVTDPWCVRFNEFLNEHKGATFYQACTPERAEIIYCAETGSGVWFLPGMGMGILQSKALQAMKQIVEAL